MRDPVTTSSWTWVALPCVLCDWVTPPVVTPPGATPVLVFCAKAPPETATSAALVIIDDARRRARVVDIFKLRSSKARSAHECAESRGK